MIKKQTAFLTVVMAAFLLSSCLGSDDDDDTTYYSDTAIQSFTLGTLNVIHDTIASDGVTDSIYTTTLTGSNYKFYIDQLTANVYNPDSLPVGTDVAHVLATITTLNSGTAILRLKNQSGEDSLAYYSSSDSIDFTEPVQLRVYNMRGTAYREYTIKLNVHKENANEFHWSSETIEGLEDVTNKVFYNYTNGTMYLSGMRNGVSVLYIKSAGGTWREVTSEESYPDYLGMTDNSVYYLRNDSLLRRDISSQALSVESLDDDPSNLPNTDVNLIVKKSEVNDGTYNLTLIGNRDGKTMIWGKVEESDNASNTWYYYQPDEYNTKSLPCLANLRAVSYGDGIIATGGDFSKVYYSPDNGLTWDDDTTYALPASFGTTATTFALGADTNNILYISKDGSNEILSGRLAKLGWKKEETAFSRARR